jgi:hypothetical protein
MDAFPPELYLMPGRAVLEAERWANALVPEGTVAVQPFEDRWTAGDFDVRLVEIDWMPVEQPWIGSFWDRSGTPDPEALLLDGRDDALAWVSEPIAAEAASPSVVEEPWQVSGSTLVRGEEVHAVAQLAKLIG